MVVSLYNYYIINAFPSIRLQWQAQVQAMCIKSKQIKACLYALFIPTVAFELRLGTLKLGLFFFSFFQTQKALSCCTYEDVAWIWNSQGTAMWNYAYFWESEHFSIISDFITDYLGAVII